MTFTPDTHVVRTPDGGAVVVCAEKQRPDLRVPSRTPRETVEDVNRQVAAWRKARRGKG